MNAILIIFVCQSFSTMQGITYSAKGANAHHAQARADYACTINENYGTDPEHPSENTCVDLGCKPEANF